MEEFNNDFTFDKMKLHLKTILNHKRYVYIYCNRCNMPWVGLMHDMSKFSPSEFIDNVRYTEKGLSPIIKKKQLYGFSESWMHHKAHNPHHYEYWTDDYDEGGYCVRMPFRYIVECMCDYLGANMAYNDGDGSYQSELNWWKKARLNRNMHPDSIEFLDRVFEYLAATERGDVFTVDESTNIERNGKIFRRSITKKIISDSDVFNIAFLELLYNYIIDKNGNPIKIKFLQHKDSEIKYYEDVRK